MKRLKDILLETDITLSAFLMGVALIIWGSVAFAKFPEDFINFGSLLEVGGIWFWFANYLLVGLGFVYLAYRGLPKTGSLLIGGYSILVWTWVASIREYSGVTSGLTLNFMVILMGVLLVQRSSKSNDI